MEEGPAAFGPGTRARLAERAAQLSKASDEAGSCRRKHAPKIFIAEDDYL